MAVPCWSSWKTGMSSISLSRSSTSKQVGAAMSSRLMPPQTGAIAAIVRMRTSGSFESMQIGYELTPPNSLNSIDLPSITGMPAAAPMSPSPRTAVPLVMTATMFRLRVKSKALLRSSAIAWHTRATPGM